MARLRLATRRWAWTSARPVWCILAQVRRRTCPLERGCAVSPYPIDRICHFSHMCDPVQACGVARTHQGAPAARSQRTYGAPCAPAARVTAAPGTDPRDPWWTGERPEWGPGVGNTLATPWQHLEPHPPTPPRRPPRSPRSRSDCQFYTAVPPTNSPAREDAALAVQAARDDRLVDAGQQQWSDRRGRTATAAIYDGGDKPDGASQMAMAGGLARPSSPRCCSHAAGEALPLHREALRREGQVARSLGDAPRLLRRTLLRRHRLPAHVCGVR
jgi:hypothetical protein